MQQNKTVYFNKITLFTPPLAQPPILESSPKDTWIGVRTLRT